MGKKVTRKLENRLTVQHIINLAHQARTAIAAGAMQATDPVHVSLEVLKEGDETTYENRVHGGEVVQSNLVENFGGGKYLHIQLMGEPNFEVYP